MTTNARFFLEQVVGPVNFRQIITGGELTKTELRTLAAKHANHNKP